MPAHSALLAAAIAIATAVFLLPSASRLSWTPRGRFADMILANATIYTADPARPFADAMAVRAGRVLRVGTYGSVKELKGRHTYELNLSGKIVLPGFIDSHVHFIDGGLQLARVPLRGVSSKDDFISKVKEAVRDKFHGQWILGGGWNNDVWGGDFPTAAWLDDISPDNPVWLSRMDGHMGVANSLAMKIAGIDKNTNDPIGGTIMRTTEGEPTGLLVDTAMKLVFDVIQEVSIRERRDALLRASTHALKRGVTTVVDVGSYFPGSSAEKTWQDFSDIYEWAHSMGKMTIRACLFFPMPTWSRTSDLIDEHGRSLSQWIHLGGVKAFLDGSLGSSSALFHEPYEGDLGNSGLQVVDMDNLLNRTIESDRAGLQVAIHAIGDKANDMLLDMFDKVVDSNGVKDRRFRIEHAQHLAPGAANRFGKHGTIASVQPDHVLDDANSAAKKIGIERAERSSYKFRSLLAGGARLTFGSDWPVSDINPLQAIQTAMSRKPPGWEVPWIPAERLSLDESLKAHTISAAYACFLDHVVGSLSEGKYADFVVLLSTSWDEFSNDLPGHVLATYVSGKQAYP
ncbi:protein LONG AFTER FAR-RED 3-like [Phragmites australis]|uniref:protein LONG AFTER FAR-RED 3-like n=1 Tax=Phragmites australis TaxID=29695 RepID=UPI002D768009|nr:protein LONG AFTER FAR-RED 3-like [Phragmites australis]